VLTAGFAVVLGHSFPPYIGFRGGQGVAALIGVYLVLAPLATAVTLVLMGIVLLLIRNIFLMICIVGSLLPLIVWLFHGSILLILYSLAIVIFLAFRSRRGFQQFKEIKLVRPRIPNPFSKKQAD
jgi:glycerol-3-phosphate acyltransferase PlsY